MSDPVLDRLQPVVAGPAPVAKQADDPILARLEPMSPATTTLGTPGMGSGDQTATLANWKNLYGGLDDVDRRVSGVQRHAFAQMDRVVKEPKEARARAINQSFVADAYGLHGPWVEQNWDSVKVALVDKEFGEKTDNVDERWLYGKIAERLGSKQGAQEQFEQAELKPWTWKDRVGSWFTDPYRKFTHSEFWESINRPFKELPEPPSDLPDVWVSSGGVPVNPAVAAGVYKGAIKPLLESLESPLGIATMGIGSGLKGAGATIPAAKKALAGLSGGFAAIMAYSTAKAAPDAIRLAMNPKTPTQDKVTAISGVAGTAAMTVLGTLGAAFELMPDKGAGVSKALEGKTPRQAAEILRQEAVTATPEAATALAHAATTLDEIGAYERGPEAWTDPKPVGRERVAAAAVRTADGNVVEASSHAEAKAQIAGAAIEQNPDGTWRAVTVSTDGEVVMMDGLKDEAEARKVAAGMSEGVTTPEKVAKAGEALAAGEQEGFTTTTGRFVDRQEAATIAADAGQLKPEPLPPSEGTQSTEITPKVETPAAVPKELHSHQVELDPELDAPRSSFGQTSLKNAYGELERAAYGFDEAPPAEKRNMAERWERSGEVLAKNPEAGRQLAERLLGNPNIGLTDDQSALLLRHKVGLQNALNEAADLAADATQSDELRAEARAQVNDLSNQLVQLLDAVNRRGSEWGREGRWRQAIAREDYSFATQEALLRAANGGRELTEAEREGLMARIKTLEEAQAKYEAKIAALQAQPREQAVEQAVRTMSRPPRAPRKFKAAEAIRDRLHTKAEESKKFLFESGRLFSISPEVLYHMSVIGADQIYSTGLDVAEWSASMVKELGEKAQPMLAEVWEASKKLFHTENRQAMIDELKGLDATEQAKKIGPFAQELARAKIEDGLKGRDAVVDAVWADLKEAIPTVTRRQTMDAISGYGQFKPLSHDEITDQLRDLKGQLQQVGKLEDMAAGQAPKKTGVERRQPSDDERALMKQVEAKKKEGGYAVTDPERQLRSALMAVKRGLDNQIKDLAREFDTGEKPPRGKPAPTDERAEILKSIRDRIKETLAAVEEQAEMPPEERIKRAVDSTTDAIDRLEKQLNEGKIFPDPTKTSEPWSPAISKLKQQLEDLKNFRKEMQKFVRPPQTPEQRALSAVKGNLKRQIESLEKQITAREKAAPKSKVPVALDAEAEGLKARRDELREEYERVFGRPELTPEQRLNIWKASAQRRLADLQERLANKEFEPRQRKPLVLDEEAARLKGQIERVRQDFAIERMKAEEAAQPRWLKAFRQTSALARASALSGYHTLAKLAQFSLARFAETPVNETIGAGLRQIPGVKEIAAKANAEAGAEMDGLATFYVRAATRGMRDSAEMLKTGKSGLKAELGDPIQNAQPVHWYDYFGILHMTEKSPLLRGDFELRLEKMTQWAIANGMDVNDPMVSGALRHDAFAYAQRSILQENNTLSSWVNSLTRQLEAVNPKTGKIDVTKAALSMFVKTFMTKGIVRTPANYVVQTLARTPLGLAKGTAQAFVAHMQGIDKLTPEEANAIMRLLKVGAVGTAVFLWGAIDASKDPKDRIFGGYYQPGDKRNKDDVGFGRIRVNGWEMPQILTHNPLTESAQMGSTFYRVMKQKLKKKGKATDEEKGIVAGAATALVSLASEAPIVSPITREVQELERGDANKFVWDEIAGLIPMFAQNLARDIDDNKSRRPETFQQSLEQFIPGMRENVPETKAQKERDARERAHRP